jgi:hypothetical protein
MQPKRRSQPSGSRAGVGEDPRVEVNGWLSRERGTSATRQGMAEVNERTIHILAMTRSGNLGQALTLARRHTDGCARNRKTRMFLVVRLR